MLNRLGAKMEDWWGVELMRCLDGLLLYEKGLNYQEFHHHLMGVVIPI
jgi:hypothetical protein